MFFSSHIVHEVERVADWVGIIDAGKLVTTSTTGVVIYDSVYVFLGTATSLWIMLPFAISLKLGTGTFSGELGGGTADFIRSRPVAWWKLLLAKLIVGIGMITASMVLAAIVFRILCPEQYVAFANVPELMWRTGDGILFPGIGYFIGVACSAVLPSTMGGALVGFVIILSVGLEVSVENITKHYPASCWSYYARFIGALIATVAFARFGLTQSTRWRLWRFAEVDGTLTNNQRAAAFSDSGLDLSELAPDQYARVAQVIQTRNPKYLKNHDARTTLKILRTQDSKQFHYVFEATTTEDISPIKCEFTTPKYEEPKKVQKDAEKQPNK